MVAEEVGRGQTGLSTRAALLQAWGEGMVLVPGKGSPPRGPEGMGGGYPGALPGVTPSRRPWCSLLHLGG